MLDISTPIFVEKLKSYVFLIDSQGLSAYDNKTNSEANDNDNENSKKIPCDYLNNILSFLISISTCVIYKKKFGCRI